MPEALFQPPQFPFPRFLTRDSRHSSVIFHNLGIAIPLYLCYICVNSKEWREQIWQHMNNSRRAQARA